MTPSGPAIYLVAASSEAHAAAAIRLKAEALKRGYRDPKLYRDHRRAGAHLHRLLADVERGIINLVLVEHLSFLAPRSRLAALHVARELHRLGVEVVSLHEPWWDPEAEPIKWLAADEVRRQKRAAKTREAMRKRGEAIGNAPLGFGLGPDGALVPDERERWAMARALELKAKGWRLCAIARDLHEQGFRSRYDTPISHTWVARALRATANTGR